MLNRIYGWTLLVFVVLAVFNAPQILFRGTGFNAHVHLAQSFLDGRLDVDPPAEPIDLIEYGGRFYVPFPPAPAVLLVPFVAVFGLSFSPLWITPFLGALTALVLFLLYRRLTRDDELSYTLSAAMIFGTAYWLCVRYAFDAYLAHMLTVLVVSLALYESLGRRRGWLIGLCLGIGCASRQLTVFVIPFVLAMLWFPPDPRIPLWRRLQPCIAATAVLSLVFGGLLWYNHARFGAFIDTGYARVIEPDWYAYRLERWGNFNWRYIPSNFLRVFLSGFSIQFEPPGYMVPVMSSWGTSLTFASPFVFYAFLGRLPFRLPVRIAGWICAGVILLAVLMHKSAGGGWQINGMRYALDFLPLLSIFIAVGMQHAGGEGVALRIRRVVIAYAIVLNLLAIVITHTRHFFPS